MESLSELNVIGRGSASTITVDDAEVSRRQAEIRREHDGSWAVTDLGSANGTQLNDRPLVVPCPLRPGDVLQMGGTEIVLLGEPEDRPDETPSAGNTTSIRPGGDRSVLVGKSPAMQEVFQLIRKASESKIPVLIEGETGTGKELVARSIHSSSARTAGPFIALNCAAMPESLLESELFGHKKGAFTGAAADRAGLIESAQGGTLFLDEIGEAPTALQPKLLRALQEGEVLRVGENAPRKVDFRLVAATNRSLVEEVEAGTFRADLYYRVSTLTLPVPALRDRDGDVGLLAEIFFNAAMRRAGKRLDGISTEALAALEGFRWPGNVRELQNEMERAVALADPGRSLELSHLSAKIREAIESPLTDLTEPTRPTSHQDRKEEFERQEIRSALARNDGKKTVAAKELGMTRQGLLKKMRRLGMVD